ncbi:MAG: STAS domain-containing protein [Thermoanaerobaculia bacterium]
MIVEKRRIGPDTLLVVEGVIKLGESASFFAKTLARVLEEEGRHVLVDMAQINQMDSTGIGELVGYLGKFAEARRRLILVAPSERVRRLLRVVQLDSLFPIYETQDAAISALAGVAAEGVAAPITVSGDRADPGDSGAR